MAPVQFPDGVASGEATPTGAVLWTRTDRPALVMVEVSTQPDLGHPRAFRAIRRTSTSSDLTIKFQARRLRPDTQYFYRWRQAGNRAFSDTGGPAGLAAIQGLLADVLEVECQALDAVSYGLVEVDAAAKTATITLKDETGSVLLDDLTAEPCSHTVGP